MKERILASIFVAVLALAGVYCFAPDLNDVPAYYAKNIRASLFTGLLTVGSFLLSLQAFIVVKLKENVFDSEVYKKRLSDLRKLNPNLTLYGPVKRLSSLLFISTASAILASVCQLTIGLVQNWAATFVSIFAATFAISMLTSALLLIKSTLGEWLDCLEEHNNQTHQNDCGEN